MFAGLTRSLGVSRSDLRWRRRCPSRRATGSGVGWRAQPFAAPRRPRRMRRVSSRVRLQLRPDRFVLGDRPRDRLRIALALESDRAQRGGVDLHYEGKAGGEGSDLEPSLLESGEVAHAGKRTPADPAWSDQADAKRPDRLASGLRPKLVRAASRDGASTERDLPGALGTETGACPQG
jgi:hypothetical protein